jgi:hypothetical protein
MSDMHHSQFGSKTPVVINGTKLVPTEVNGERIVTLALIDQVHGRASGTASRNFRENRDRLIEGEDFYELTADEIRRQSLGHLFPPRTPKGIVLAESGYLMLVKSMNDDLAWRVQKALVKTYFAKKSSPVPFRQYPRLDVNREHRLTMNQNVRLAKMAGLSGNQALLAANKATVTMTGIDALGLMGITHMNAPQNEPLLTPTEIGRRAGVGSARSVNQALCAIGLQQAFRDAKDHLYYELTDAGHEAGGIMQDTGKKHSTGTPIRQLKWPSSIIGRIQDGEKV